MSEFTNIFVCSRDWPVAVMGGVANCFKTSCDEMLDFHNVYHYHHASPRIVGWKWWSCLHCKDNRAGYGGFALEQKKWKPSTEVLIIISGHRMASACLGLHVAPCNILFGLTEASKELMGLGTLVSLGTSDLKSWFFRLQQRKISILVLSRAWVVLFW